MSTQISIEEYQKKIAEVPIDRVSFIFYMSKNNKVIYRSNFWLGVENIKYHTEKYPHYTFFYIGSRNWNDTRAWSELLSFADKHPEFSFYYNKKKDRSVNRWHCHFITKIIDFKEY